ncbi:MAG: flagellar biosynthesis protein FlhF [Desulfococcaceae bacterium]|jgi:flagellar biosynthesis protein FlhF|nr:flagellar biosynthesis protein FlhF [Desulfococcaceae bacterium]
MKIKRFKAESMNLALEKIKQEFGANAVILSVKEIRKGISIFGRPKIAGVELTAATDSPLREAGARHDNKYPNTVKTDRYNRPSGRNGEKSGLQRKIIATKFSNDSMPALSDFHKKLLSQDVKENIAWEVIGKISHKIKEIHPSPAEIGAYMNQVLKEKGLHTFVPKSSGRKIISLIGPAGAGKTTTLVKLAAIQSLRGKDVAIITLDNERIGAVGQLRIYANIIGIPLTSPSNVNDLHEILKEMNGKEYIFIDTPGASPLYMDRIRDIKEKLIGIPDLENHLLISAATKEKDMEKLFEIFSIIPIHALIVTKTDESVSFGNLLNHLYRKPLPLSYFTTGSQVPDDIIPASPEKLTGLLTGFPADHFYPYGSAHISPEKADCHDAADRTCRHKEPYVASHFSDVFHDADCKCTAQIKADNIVYFSTAEMAVQKGYSPCKTCMADYFRNTMPSLLQNKIAI